MKFRLPFTILVSLFIFIGATYAQNSTDTKTNSESGPVAFLQYGALGAIVIAGGWYILFLHKAFSKQHESFAKQMEAKDAVIKEHTEKMLVNFKENTTILTELKTLIQQDIMMKRTEKT